MQVNKDRAKQVIAAMKEDALRSYESGTQSKYSFESFCREHKLFDSGREDRIEDTIISCPFHSDSTPSCHLNEGMWAYNCFGCRGGNFLNFKHRYETEILGRDVSWYRMLEEMLKQDKVISARLGFNSIYEKETVDLQNFGKFTRTQFKAKKQLPDSYLALCDKFKKLNPSISDKKLFITMMQSDISVKEAYKEFFGKGDQNRKSDSKKQYDLAELDAFGEDS